MISIRRLTIAAAALAATAALSLGAAMPAGAIVGSGAGGVAHTDVQCQSLFGMHYFSATARVNQEFDGQNVAVRFWTYDALGWHNYGWVGGNNPGWNYDGAVSFRQDFNINGSWAYLYIEYSWLSSIGWHGNHEWATSYPTVGFISGQDAGYCRG